MRPDFEPKGMASGVGSLPDLDPAEAVKKVLAALPECPFWPQFPVLSPLEGMTLQYTAGLPGDLDPERTTGQGSDMDEEIAAFYARVLAAEVESFALPQDRASGPGAFRSAIELQSTPPRCMKGHVTGPVTLASALKHGGRDVIHDETLRDVAAAQLAMNARWQVRELKTLGAEEVIIFLDEPSMEAFGSAFSTFDRETVLSLWTPILDAIREEGGLSGIHCCGNTAWDLLFASGTDIVNFDAFHFMEKITLYAADTKRFLEAGGILAWGIVPTSEEIEGVTAEDLYGKLMEGMQGFEKAGIEPGLLRRRAILTPSCGMGSLTVELSGMVLEKLAELSRIFREREKGWLA